MTDITIIVPLHTFDNEVEALLQKALDSVLENRQTYKNGKLPLMIICPTTVKETINENANFKKYEDLSFLVNDGETDFCTQINLAAKTVQTDFFSILEFDDIYRENWFKMAHDYYFTNESVSLFLPINVMSNPEHKVFQYINEIAWTNSFSSEIGFLDFDCLQDYPSFNLTGGIFNTKDFNTIGGFDSSIKVAFNYEYLLRLTKKELKVYVVPKEGYVHCVGRKGSLTDEYNNTLTDEDINNWFKKAKEEHAPVIDKKKKNDKK